MENKPVTARLDIEIFVDCPKCEYLINLLDPKDTNGTNHDEESEIMKQVFPSGVWISQLEKLSVKDVTCTSCKHTFNVEGLEY